MAVLFDTRRRTCHSLVLNYFIAGGGLSMLVQQFGALQQVLWQELELKRSQPEHSAGAGPQSAVCLPFFVMQAACYPSWVGPGLRKASYFLIAWLPMVEQPCSVIACTDRADEAQCRKHMAGSIWMCRNQAHLWQPPGRLDGQCSSSAQQASAVCVCRVL